MTALTAPAPTPAPAPHLLRWLIRLHRPALYIWAALLVVTAATLLWLGGPLTDDAAAAWREYRACQTPQCAYDQDAIILYKDVYNYATIAVLAIPFLIAAWAGASLIGRELENGTDRLAWTQSVSPARWLAAKLAAPAVLVTAGTGLLVLLHHLAWSTGEGKIDTAKPWHDSATFFAGGPVTVALALTGLLVGALAGLVLRRSLAALGAGAVAVAGLWFAVWQALPHLWPTASRLSSLRDGPSLEGMAVDYGLVTSSGDRIADPGCGGTIIPECRPVMERLDATAYYTDFHPASHYWPLQLTATAIVLVVAAAATLIAFRLVRHRTG
ncbi:ABC transporter permease [Streptomyces sp. DG2A-72]|uniref:ABC transporter permease n=1 Tax=Streptomyces sp. DG2A-72 TaxID=3051386 RepID=UPI00265B8A57|nr:ABC transporter permease [Streptomyces sp. DG2A-72]MDO0934290.1 ABC transporter permease [Streptomyces sp. DG2A-72]